MLITKKMQSELAFASAMRLQTAGLVRASWQGWCLPAVLARPQNTLSVAETFVHLCRYSFPARFFEHRILHSFLKFQDGSSDSLEKPTAIFIISHLPAPRDRWWLLFQQTSNLPQPSQVLETAIQMIRCESACGCKCMDRLKLRKSTVCSVQNISLTVASKL